MIQDPDPLHELEGRERIGADTGRYPFGRIVVLQHEPRIMRIEPGFLKPSPEQIEVRIQKQPYQLCVERSEYLSSIQCARGPVLVNHIDEVGMMSGLVDAMIADRIADGTHDTSVTRDPSGG